MADSSLIPDILDHIVNDEIIPLLPWHTRPLLIALSDAWRNALDVIGVRGGKKLDPIRGERMARATRLKQLLKCRLAVEYYHIYHDRQNHFIEPAGYVVKLFDGQWRNVAPITGRGSYTHRGYREALVLGVVDGTLYFLQSVAGDNLGIRIIALDVGGGLWQWKEVFTSEHHHPYLRWHRHICRSGRIEGDLFVYGRCDEGLNFEIREIPAWERISDSAPNEDLGHTAYSPRPIFVYVGNRLYFFGEVSYTENVRFLDLNTRGTWNSSRVVSDIRGTYNVEKDVLLVAYSGIHFHILRYDSFNKRWIIAAQMLAPDDPFMKWTWCVEYDHHGEKQLWIYIFSEKIRGVAFNLYKLRVVERLHGRLSTRKAWDDVVLSDLEVECELVDPTPLDQSFQPIEPFDNGNGPIMFVGSFHGFHRSDSTNFQDIPH